MALDPLEPTSEQMCSLTPKDELEWVPLPKHPLFSSSAARAAAAATSSSSTNLLAWDGASRLYFWDSATNSLHHLSLRLGDPDPTSVLAASPSEVLQADVELSFDVRRISINRNGTAMLLFGSQRLSVIYLCGRASKKDVNLICRTITVGSETYSNGSNDIRVLQALWHPYSDTHLGILSSDSVFRLFNLAEDPLQPEQEYYLQPVESGRFRSASSVCPVDFSFGGDHLWDRFSVFISFSGGAIYVLCPVFPFGSLFKCESLLEIYTDAQTFGLKSANSVAASNSKLAISWLEATFPELQNQETDGDNLSLIRAHAYVIFDASLVLQGPLKRVGQGGNEDLVGCSAECEGRVVSFLYNLVSKDSILVTAWSGGQLQIDALADEIQPLWSVGSPPSLRVDSHDQILGLAMICESIASNHLENLDHNAWLGSPPPLLRLGIVDLALPRKTESGYNISLFNDTLMPERIYSLHVGGIDSIMLHFLPFTSQANGKDDTMRTPSVHPVLNTCQNGCTSEPSLCGFVSLSDSFGYSWIVAVTLSQECVVLEMKTGNLLLPLSMDTEKKLSQSEGESKEREILTILSKELLSGPKEVLVPQASPNLCSVAADSIEGRSTLHQYFKLFHETYVKYAHKVYMELKHHTPQLKKIINDQHSRLGDAQQKLLKVEEKESVLQKRIKRAVQMHNSLEERLQRLRNLPCAHKKPLSRPERQLKSEPVPTDTPGPPPSHPHSSPQAVVSETLGSSSIYVNETRLTSNPPLTPRTLSGLHPEGGVSGAILGDVPLVEDPDPVVGVEETVAPPVIPASAAFHDGGLKEASAKNAAEDVQTSSKTEVSAAPTLTVEPYVVAAQGDMASAEIAKVALSTHVGGSVPPMTTTSSTPGGGGRILPISEVEAHLAELRCPLPSESHNTLVRFLSAHPSMFLSTHPLHRGAAYSALAEFLLLAKRICLRSLTPSLHEELSYLLGAMRAFAFDPVWLSKVEDQILSSSSGSPLEALPRVIVERDTTFEEMNRLAAKVARIKESLSSAESSYLSCSEKYAALSDEVAKLTAAVDTPLFDF